MKYPPTNALLSEVHVHDKEHESARPVLLTPHQGVHPPATLQLGQQAAVSLVANQVAQVVAGLKVDQVKRLQKVS